MQTDEALNMVLHHLLDRQLGAALDAMDGFLASHPNQSDADRLFAIRTDFQLMADYWKQGFKDAQLPGLYENLLQRTYMLYANMAKSYAFGHSAYLSSIYMRIHMTARDWSPQVFRAEMEGFVSETAMLELLPEHKRQEKRRELCKRHQHEMDVLFDYLWTSSVWADGMASAMEEILLSPTIDTNDQQLMVSGIMLSLLNHFDIAKFRTLINVYQQAADESVRQRALVGWVFSAGLTPVGSLFPEQQKLVREVLDNQSCQEELVALQKQIVFCTNAERDHHTIQSEILPDLMKGSNFRVTRNGIEEVEEDPMEDILHSDEQERKLEHLEESFQRMVEMQRQGSDIYFGGFSQMKRFPFFYELSSWFVPFYMDHPAIAQVVEKMNGNRFMESMMENGPFCHSDKYSFVLAFERVMGQLPENLRQMLNRGEASMGEVQTEERSSSAYIRRMYLQDLYRFYKVFPHRNEFVNPFEMSLGTLFFSREIYRETPLEGFFGEIAAFLMKQKRMRWAGEVLMNNSEASRDFHFYMMAGYLTQHKYFRYAANDREMPSDLECYSAALELQPQSEKALSGLARALFNRGSYQEALTVYDQLLSVSPDKKSYLLNNAVCLANLKQFEAAQKILFRLNYEAPDDQNVSRVLAWVLTCNGKYEQAEKYYSQLMTAEPLADDLLNFGYCLWLAGQVGEAANCFRRYLKDTEEDATTILEHEKDLLEENGITEPEMQLMLYIL